MLDQIFEESTSDAEQLQAKQMQSAEIVLEPDVLAALCRRGRRRMRDIQSSSQATLKLDRFRGVLQVTGFQDSIADVLRQLESLSGPCLSVTAAVWAELMRTRKIEDMTQAAVARIQHESGCRVHIDRNSQDVRLFGRQDKIVVAQRLLEELEPMCVEEIVDMKGPLALDTEQLQVVAQVFGVGLQLEQRQVTILGISGAVTEAANQLRKSDSDQTVVGEGLDAARPSEAAHLAISEAMSALKGDGESHDSTYSDLQAQGVTMMQGTVTTKLPVQRASQNPTRSKGASKAPTQSAPAGACLTCGDSSNFCVHCGKPVRKIMEGPNAGCVTCGAVNFCVFCGHPTEKMSKGAGGGATAAQQSFSEGYNQDMSAAAAAGMPMMPMQYFQGGNPQSMMMGGMMCMPNPMMGYPQDFGMKPMMRA